MLKNIFLALLLIFSPIVAHAELPESSPWNLNDEPQKTKVGVPDPIYSKDYLLDVGHRVFGEVSGGFATALERLLFRFGEPNGYIIGEEAGGSFFGGLRYGEGYIYTQNTGEEKLFWQGPSIGFDIGGDGNRTMMLVYKLKDANNVFKRYVGVDGSAYMIGGLGVSVLRYGDSFIIPIRSGVGARLGINAGYMKFTKEATWNPF